MTNFTRISVAGSVRRAEVVIPDNEPIGTLLPQFVDLLREPQSALGRPLTLVGVDGDEIDITRTPDQLGIAEGTMLRLTHVDAAPPPPVVIDVADAVADGHAIRPDVWGERSRTAVATGLMIAATALVGSIIPLDIPLRTWILSGALIAVAIASFVCGFYRARRANLVLAGAATGIALPTVTAWTSWVTTYDPIMFTGSIAVFALSVVLAISIGAGRRNISAVTGGLIGIALSGLQMILLWLGFGVPQSITITAIGAVLLLGVLPWVALSASGLADIDTQATARRRITRLEAASAIDAAYATLTWGVAACTAMILLGSVRLIFDQELWAGLLAIALVLALALRTRSFPLVGAHVIVWSAVALICAVGVIVAMPLQWWTFTLLGVAIATIFIGGVAQPQPHVRARIRGWANLLEGVVIVALIPLALGIWHVYQDLLAMFGGS